MSASKIGVNGVVHASWATAGRPASPVAGQSGWNSTLGALDIYNGSSWFNLANIYTDASGNVGVGGSPITKFNVFGTTTIQGAASTTARINMFNNASTTNGFLLGQGYASGTDNIGVLFNIANAPIVFGVNNTEAMRIDSSTTLFVNCQASPSASVSGVAIKNPLVAYSVWSSGSYTGQIYQIGFMNGNGLVGRIETNGTATNFVTSSDERLKENIVDAPSALQSVGNLKVRSFDWKGDSKHQEFGLVAQEVNTVAPEAVSQGLEETDMWGVDFGKLVPRLVKAIQEQQALIVELKADVAALKTTK
jgi:Chaperone of endosialidase